MQSVLAFQELDRKIPNKYLYELRNPYIPLIVIPNYHVKPSDFRWGNIPVDFICTFYFTFQCETITINAQTIEERRLAIFVIQCSKSNI